MYISKTSYAMFNVQHLPQLLESLLKLAKNTCKACFINHQIIYCNHIMKRRIKYLKRIKFILIRNIAF